MVMAIGAAYQHVLDFVRELEQRRERRGLERELEQQPDEFERECGLSLGLRFFPHTSDEDSGTTGICCPAVGKIKHAASFW
jgi:hypothetical protein